MKAEEAQTWREMLGILVNENQDVQQVAMEVGVNPMTITRWINGISTPRPNNLRQLPEVVPARYREQFIMLLQKEFSGFSLEKNQVESVVPEIPSAFYASVVNVATTSPQVLRSSSICTSVLQQILRHLDPQKKGLQALIIECMPSASGEKVRSLRLLQGRGTTPWSVHTENIMLLLGAESLAGRSVTTGHMTVAQSKRELETQFPIHQVPYAHSVAAFPLLLFDRVAGCLYITSTQEGYFIPSILEIVHQYADLLGLALEQAKF